MSEKVAVQLCRLLRPRDSCAKCGCCASPGGVTHLQEKKGSPRWAKIPASRKYEKTRARSSYRKRTSRYASRARATARCARRALHPTKQSKIHLCRDPSGGAAGRRSQKKCFGISKETVDRGTHDAPQNNNLPVIQIIIQLIFDIGKLARHRRRQQWPTSCEPAASRSATTSRGGAKKP